MNFKGTGAYICGIDVDDRVGSNAMVHEGKVADAANIPYDDGVFDVIFADNVLEHLPEPINQQVSVINCSLEEITLAVADPQVANYLRLYAAEVQQQIHETLGMKQKLKIQTMPDSILNVGTRPASSKPARVSQQTVDAISKNANWVEDEYLRKSLLSLASSLKTK